MAYLAGTNFFEGLLGEKGRRYVPYLMTVAIYIAFSNLIGVFGVKPPTKDLDVTAALALMSIVLIEGGKADGHAREDDAPMDLFHFLSTPCSFSLVIL